MEEALAADRRSTPTWSCVDTVYGNDDVRGVATTRRSALVDNNPDLELIMAPTTVGIAAAAKAMQDEGLCETGQGLRPRAPRRDGGVTR